MKAYLKDEDLRIKEARAQYEKAAKASLDFNREAPKYIGIFLGGLFVIGIVAVLIS